MKPALALVAAAALLAACGAPAPAHHARTVAKPPSCDSQMAVWVKKITGPEDAYNKALDALGRAVNAEDVTLTRAAFGRAGAAAAAMEAVPIPKCADPAGYYGKWLDHIIAAGYNARSQGGVAGIQLAEVPLGQANRLHRRLQAELAQRTRYTGI